MGLFVIVHILKTILRFCFATSSLSVFADFHVGFSEVVQNVKDSVVSITLHHKDDFPLPASCPSRKEKKLQDFIEWPSFMGLKDCYRFGSGFVVDSCGYIVTNRHVVVRHLKDQAEIYVHFANGQRYPAKIVAMNAGFDLAVLKINPTHPLKKLSFGKSSLVKSGHFVLAAGNPFGLEASFQTGIISFAHRKRPLDSDAIRVPFWIQTDIFINTGCSGGPLINTKGEVIGINTEIFTYNEQCVGISFAIPSDIAFPIIQKMILSEKFHKDIPPIEKEQDRHSYSFYGLLLKPAHLLSEKEKTRLGWQKKISEGLVVLCNDYPQKIDLKKGDIILLAGMKPMRDLQDFLDFWDQIQSQSKAMRPKSILILAFRQGKGTFHALIPLDLSQDLDNQHNPLTQK